MKKIAFTFLLLAIIGCVSLGRNPASIKPDKFSFHLYGGNPLTSANYNFQLVNLKALRNQSVEFQNYEISSPQSENAVFNWQRELFQELQAGRVYRFSFKNLIISVSKGDIENAYVALAAIDQTEPQADLRLRKKAEVISSFNERFKDSMDTRIEVATLPLEAISRIASPTLPVVDGDKIKIAPSSFWSPRASVDYWKGPGQLSSDKLANEVCIYNSPKRGFGVHAGFRINCLGSKSKLKVKFGNETYSGPLNSRLYHRLGFNVPAIHYIPELKVAYDRRIFSEINSRKKKFFHVQFVGKTVYDHGRLKLFDTSDFVRKVTMKNGHVYTNISEFKKNLLKACPVVPCEYTEHNIHTTFEKEIDHVTFEPSTVTEEIGEEIGSWSFSDLDHPQRTEVKSMMMLGAWTGNFDLRKDNMSLVWVKDSGELKHFLGDPGSGLGKSKGIFRSGSKIEDLAWQTTMETSLFNDDQQPLPAISLNGYKPLEENEAFRKMSFLDGQWMADQIAQVSEDEISQALAASGLSAAEFLLAREKLLSIQQKMIQHFGLRHKYADKLKRVIQKKMSFDPSSSEPVQITFSNGRAMTLEHRDIRLHKGVLAYPEGKAPTGR